MESTDLYGYFGIAFVFGIIALVVVLLVVLIKQSYKTKHIRIASAVEAAKDSEYKSFIEQSLSLQQDLKKGQEQLTAELAQLKTRMASVEKLLREVE